MAEQATLVLSIVLVATLVVHRLFDIKNLLNPFVFFFLYHTVFFFIGLAYSEIYERFGLGVSDVVRWWIIYGYGASVIGAIIGSVAFAGIGVHYVRPTALRILDSRSAERAEWVAALMLLMLGGLLFALFVSKTGFIAFQPGENFEDARIEARQGMGAISILSITSTTFGGLYLALARKSSAALKLTVLLASSVILLGYGNRAPVLRFLLAFFVLHMLVRGQGVRVRHLAAVALFVLGLMVLLGVLRKGETINVGVAFLASLPWRPYVTLSMFQRVVDFFPNTVAFLGGAGYIIELKTLMPGASVNFGTWVKEAMGLTFEGGSVTISYLGDAYINFGWLGVIVAPLTYGFMLCSLYYVFTKRQSIPLWRAILLFLISMALSGSATGGFLTPVLYYIIPYLVIVFAFRTLAAFLPRATRA